MPKFKKNKKTPKILHRPPSLASPPPQVILSIPFLFKGLYDVALNLKLQSPIYLLKPSNLNFYLLAQMPTANASDAEADAYAEADVDGVVADGGCLHLHRRRPTGLHYVEAAVISPT